MTIYTLDLPQSTIDALANGYSYNVTSQGVSFPGGITLTSSTTTPLSYNNTEIVLGYAYNTANDANVHAHAAFNYANTISGGSAVDNVARTLAQSSYTSGNTTLIYAEAAYAKANTGMTSDQYSRDKANSAFNHSNTTLNYAQAGYSKANADGILVQASFNHSNTTLTYAQSAFDSGNTTLTYAQAGYSKANSSYTYTDTISVISQAAFNKANADGILAQAAFDTANTASSSGITTVNDPANVLPQYLLHASFSPASEFPLTAANTSGESLYYIPSTQKLFSPHIQVASDVTIGGDSGPGSFSVSSGSTNSFQITGQTGHVTAGYMTLYPALNGYTSKVQLQDSNYTNRILIDAGEGLGQLPEITLPLGSITSNTVTANNLIVNGSPISAVNLDPYAKTEDVSQWEDISFYLVPQNGWDGAYFDSTFMMTHDTGNGGYTLDISISWSNIAYGDGNWVTLPRYRISDFGVTLYARHSYDGVNWSPSIELPANDRWAAVAYGNKMFVAVGGYESYSNNVVVSTDGITWSAHTLPMSAIWNNIQFYGGKFWILGNTNVYLTSTDGINWTQNSLSTNANWLKFYFDENGVAASGQTPGLRIWAIPYCTYNGHASGFYDISTDGGTNWSQISIGHSYYWADIIFDPIANSYTLLPSLRANELPTEDYLWKSNDINLFSSTDWNVFTNGMGYADEWKSLNFVQGYKIATSLNGATSINTGDGAFSLVRSFVGSIDAQYTLSVIRKPQIATRVLASQPYYTGDSSISHLTLKNFRNSSQYRNALVVDESYDNNIDYPFQIVSDKNDNIGIGYGAGTSWWDNWSSNPTGVINIGWNVSTGGMQPGDYSIAIGYDDVGYDAATGSIAIGHQAGFADSTGLGLNQIAIGTMASWSDGQDNSIVLNATGSDLSPTNSGLFIKPITFSDTIQEYGYLLYYDDNTGEVIKSYFPYNQSLNTNNQVTFAKVLDGNGVDYRDFPVQTKTTSYKLSSWSDSGNLISTTNNIIVPATGETFAPGQTVTIFNSSSSNITISAENSSYVTLYLAGTSQTGTRTLAQKGLATIVCVNSYMNAGHFYYEFTVSGAGLS